MLRVYKNALLQAIREAGFDPRDFEAEEIDVDGYLPVPEPRAPGYLGIYHKGIPAFSIAYHDRYPWFIVRNNPEDAHRFDFAFTKFGPMNPRFPREHDGFFPGTDFVAFDEVLPSFQRWLHEQVSQAMEDDAHPDLWAQLSSQQTVATDFASGPADGSTFSVEERVQVQIALREFRLLVVKTFEPGQAELQLITERLDYLSQAVDRLSRFDWQGVAIQTIIGITTALSLDTERGRILWGLFQQAMSSVVHLIR